MDVPAHIAALQEHGTGLAAAAERAGWDAPVPTCPDWTVRDLVAHQGGVHRWASAIVGDAMPSPGEGTPELPPAPADDALLGWFRAGHAALVETLTAAPADLACWTFLPSPSPLAFWARRQAHETAIHHIDAESAAGSAIDIDPLLAADGVDELLLGFYARKRGRLVADPTLTLGIRIDDAGPDDAWTLVIGPEAREVSRGSARGDCVVSGKASDVYQFLWNRRDRSAVSIDGNPVVLDLWREKARVTWS